MLQPRKRLRVAAFLSVLILIQVSLSSCSHASSDAVLSTATVEQAAPPVPSHQPAAGDGTAELAAAQEAFYSVLRSLPGAVTLAPLPSESPHVSPPALPVIGAASHVEQGGALVAPSPVAAIARVAAVASHAAHPSPAAQASPEASHAAALPSHHVEPSHVAAASPAAPSHQPVASPAASVHPSPSATESASAAASVHVSAGSSASAAASPHSLPRFLQADLAGE